MAGNGCECWGMRKFESPNIMTLFSLGEFSVDIPRIFLRQTICGINFVVLLVEWVQNIFEKNPS